MRYESTRKDGWKRGFWSCFCRSFPLLTSTVVLPPWSSYLHDWPSILVPPLLAIFGGFLDCFCQATSGNNMLQWKVHVCKVIANKLWEYHLKGCLLEKNIVKQINVKPFSIKEITLIEYNPLTYWYRKNGRRTYACVLTSHPSTGSRTLRSLQ